MAFSLPTLLLTNNVSQTAGTSTFSAGSPGVTVPKGTEILVATFANVATSSVTSITDASSNTYVLIGTTGSGTTRRVDLFRGLINTQLTGAITVHYTAGATTIYNTIAVALPGSMTGEPLWGTYQSSAQLTATQAVTSLLSNYEYVIAFNAEAGNTPAWTAPAVALGTSSGSSTWFTASYTAASNSGASPTTTWTTTSSSWTMAAVGSYKYATDQYTDAYSSQYGQFTGTPWPQSGSLLVKCELLLNGTWTDITSFVYQRDGSVTVQVTDGRADESQRITPATMQLQLDNRNGTFSPRNPASPFYPYIGRNTRIRFSVPAGTNLDDAGLETVFTGEVSSWPPAWDVTGSDVWVNVTASGITRRLAQNAPLQSAFARYYLKKAISSPTYPLGLWPCTDATGSTQIAEATGTQSAAEVNAPGNTFTGTPDWATDTSFGGLGPVLVINGATADVVTSAASDPGFVEFWDPGTFSWTAPTTGTADVKAIGGGGGGSGSAAGGNAGGGGGGGEFAEEATYSVTAGTAYAVVVGAGGSGGTTASQNGTAGGRTSFDYPGVVAHGGNYGSPAHGGTGGTGSTNATHHAGGAGFGSTSVGGGGGSSGGQTANGTSATNASGGAPSDAYSGVGGDGGGATVVNYTKAYTATHTYAYQGSDAGNALLHTDTNMQQGGDIADTVNGKSKTWILFNHSQIASDLVGATITKVTLAVYCYHTWFSSGATLAFGWDTKSSFGSTAADPSAHIDLIEGGIAAGQYHTYSIGTQFGTAFKSSGATTIVLFKNSNSLSYYAKLNGSAQSNPPVLTIYYSK